MKNSLAHRIPVWIFAALLLSSTAWSQGGDRTLANEAHEIVKGVVDAQGHTFVEKGSWVNKNKTFRPTSDMDMDHFVNSPRPADPSKVAAWEKDMMNQWKKAQKDMIEAVKAKYPNDPGKAREVLEKMNVYPPSQVMGDVKDGSDAMNKFKKYNAVPNLAAMDDIETGAIGGVGEVDPNKMKKFADGYYGSGSQTWIQDDVMKKGNGVVVYKDPASGKTMTSRFPDLENAAVGGGGKYTAQGSANLGSQMIDKIFDGMRDADPGKVKKELDRLKTELQIIKNKTGMHIDISEVDDLLKAGNLGKAKDLLAGAKLQCELLKYGNTPEKLSMINKLLEKGFKGSEKIMETLSKLPVDKIATVIGGIFVTLQAVNMGVDITKGNYVKAMTDLGLMLSPAAIAIIGSITQELLEAAKQGGYNLVASRQECLDMLSGIYPDNPGYVVDSKTPDVSIEFLLLKYASCEEDKLTALIEGHARESSDKQDVQAINMAKCLAQVVPTCRATRQAYGNEYKNLAGSLSFDISAKISEPPKDDPKKDIDRLQGIREEFMGEYAAANKWADYTRRYADAFQNAIGAKDAAPCKNPTIAYLWRNLKLSFENYSSSVLRMSELEFRMRTAIAPLRNRISGMSGDPQAPDEGARDVTAKIVFPALNDMKAQLDGLAGLICGAGGKTTCSYRWYIDGEEHTSMFESAEFTGLKPGPHIIEAQITLIPFGPKDNLLDGLGYRAELTNGVKVEVPEAPDKDKTKKIQDDLLAKLKTADEVWLPQMSDMLTEHMNLTGTLGDMVYACNTQLRSYGCDLDEVEKIGNDIAQGGIDPDDLANGLRELCGDGVDNNGNGLIDEGCAGGGTVVITIWDSGSLADDSFTLSVTGYGNLGSTPAGGQRVYTLSLPPGNFTATVTCILAPDNAGTYSISFSGSSTGAGGSGTFGSAGQSATFPFTVQ
jgi:hypothetical protein